MNKKNKILVGCLALLLVLSVGYALFSETVTINGTATAKGNMDLTVSEISFSDFYEQEMDSSQHAKGIITNSSIDITDNVVTANVTLGAPGSYKKYMIEIKNTGSIPVKLKSIENVSTDTSIEWIQGIDFFKSSADGKSGIRIALSPDGGYMDDYSIKGYWIDNTATMDDETLLSAVLDPGESTYYEISHEWSSESTSQEEISMTLSLKFNWEQVTSN